MSAYVTNEKLKLSSIAEVMLESGVVRGYYFASCEGDAFWSAVNEKTPGYTCWYFQGEGVVLKFINNY